MDGLGGSIVYSIKPTITLYAFDVPLKVTKCTDRTVIIHVHDGVL